MVSYRCIGIKCKPKTFICVHNIGLILLAYAHFTDFFFLCTFTIPLCTCFACTSLNTVIPLTATVHARGGGHKNQCLFASLGSLLLLDLYGDQQDCSCPFGDGKIPEFPGMIFSITINYNAFEPLTVDNNKMSSVSCNL